MMAGLNAAGINVLDLEVASTPVTRFLAKAPGSFGGLTVRLRRGPLQRCRSTSTTRPAWTSPRTRSARSSGSSSGRTTGARCPEEIGDISFPHRALEDYTAELAQIVEPDRIAARQFKLVVDYGFGTASLAMASVLTRLRADVLAVNPYASTLGRLSFDLDASTKRVSDLVRASGRAARCRVRPRRRATDLDRRRGRRLDAHRGHPDVRGAGVRPPARGPHRPAGQHDGSRGADRHRARRHHPAHEDLRPRTHGGRHRRRGRVRGRRARRVHPPRLPARVRRGRGPGEDAGPAGPRATASSPRCAAACRPCT